MAFLRGHSRSVSHTLRKMFPLLRLMSGKGSMLGRILITMIFCLLVLVGGSSIVNTNPPASPEYLIKAAYLYNFTKFVEWPPEAFRDNLYTINLFILGTDPFGGALDSIKNKTVQGRRLNIKHVNHIEEISGCHILFISSSEKDNLGYILRALKNSTILTVSEIERFAQRGGVINFILVENKIHFEINPDAAQQSGLRIGSQLLRLAKIVTPESRKEKE